MFTIVQIKLYYYYHWNTMFQKAQCFKLIMVLEIQGAVRYFHFLEIPLRLHRLGRHKHRWCTFLTNLVACLKKCIIVFYFVQHEFEFRTFSQITPQHVFQVSPAGCSIQGIIHYAQLWATGNIYNIIVRYCIKILSFCISSSSQHIQGMFFSWNLFPMPHSWAIWETIKMVEHVFVFLKNCILLFWRNVFDGCYKKDLNYIYWKFLYCLLQNLLIHIHTKPWIGYWLRFVLEDKKPVSVVLRRKDFSSCDSFLNSPPNFKLQNYRTKFSLP